MTRLPEHATHLFACSECKRVVNAFQDFSGKDQPFNEVGLSASMLEITGDVRCGHMRCAKRSSAALRTAIAFEEDMARRCIECEPVDDGAVREALSVRVSHGIESGIAARLRRDARSALEQHREAVPCGAAPMLLVGVLGRVVRLNNEWLSLCSVCASLMRVQPHTRYGDALCCLRCDPKMAFNETELAEVAAGREAVGVRSRKLCRYCGKADPEKSGARWKTLPAPHDVAGANAALPEPLRRIHFCPLHWRPWLANALTELPTRVVIAHIGINAKPCWEAKQPVAKPNPNPKRRKVGGEKRGKKRARQS